MENIIQKPPKKNSSAYLFFCSEKNNLRLKEKSELWNRMKEDPNYREQIEKYMEMARLDKERYDRENASFKLKLKQKKNEIKLQEKIDKLREQKELKLQQKIDKIRQKNIEENDSDSNDEYQDEPRENRLAPRLRNEGDEPRENRVASRPRNERDDSRENRVAPRLRNERDDSRENRVTPRLKNERDDSRENRVASRPRNERDDSRENRVAPRLKNERDDSRENHIRSTLKNLYDDSTSGESEDIPQSKIDLQSVFKKSQKKINFQGENDSSDEDFLSKFKKH